MDFTPITAADRQEPYVAPQRCGLGLAPNERNPWPLGMAIVIVMTLLAVIGPFIPLYLCRSEPGRAMPTPGRRRHTGSVPIRSDESLVRVLYGARISLSIGLVASLINVFIGVSTAGFQPGWRSSRPDHDAHRRYSVLHSMLLYVILLMVVFKPGLLNIYLALGIAYWLNMARVVRGQILSLKQQEYVMAARSCGTSGRSCGVI